MHGLDIIGLDFTFGFGDLLKAAGGATQGVLDYQKQQDAEAAAKAALASKTQAILTADAQATATWARALMSAALHMKTAKADKAAADKAQAAQDRAARDLPDAAVQARVAAAQKALDKAHDATGAAAPFQIAAAQRTLDKANGVDVDAKSTKDQKPKKSNTLLYVLAAGAAAVGYVIYRKRSAKALQ